MSQLHSSKRTLAFSGGAALGAFQAGVWSALEDRGWRPDAVVGISIGAINGFAVAKGASGEELRALWLELPTQLIDDCGGRGYLLWKHIPLFRCWLREVVRRYEDRPWVCGFTLTCMELPSGRSRSFQEGDVTADHLLAACALPGFVTPVKLGGKIYLDNGVIYPTPLPEARATGADEIVVVDLFAVPPWPLLRTAHDLVWGRRMQAVGALAHEGDARRILSVEHSERLGGIQDCLAWRHEHATQLVDWGRTAVRTSAERGPAWAARTLGGRPAQIRPAATDAVS